MQKQTFKIVRRRLDDKEIAFLIKEIKQTPNITGFTVSEWDSFDGIFIAEIDNKLAGIIALKNTAGNWVSIEAFYVLSKYRNFGIGNKLFDAALKAAMKKKRNLYVITYNEAVVSIMRKNNLQVFDAFFKLPFFVMLANITHALNCYRVYEFIRKKIAFPADRKLTFGIKFFVE